MIMNEDQWIARWKEKGILWIADGEKSPHPKYHGDHWSGMFDSRHLCLSKTMLDEAASDLVDLLDEEASGISVVGRVVGLQPYGARLAQAVASQITSRRREICAWSGPAAVKGEITYKSPTGSKFVEPRWKENVLLVNAEMFVDREFELLFKSVEQGRGRVLNYLCQPLNTSGRYLIEMGTRPVRFVALADLEIHRYSPQDCELCPASEVLDLDNPQEAERNWARRVIARG